MFVLNTGIGMATGLSTLVFMSLAEEGRPMMMGTSGEG